jgi:hypothetical protein
MNSSLQWNNVGAMQLCWQQNDLHEIEDSEKVAANAQQ